ncbi:general substrate transporter [Talaromyces proteolyticus]|uniref:General substrate transporter n=1 Tax=Talaromyces proteolyticus TaxID=1131652 RepID=A0AAD4KJ67_9EURO|nr:general substrate transporter [Talaromyces proteolyticus]KAH8692377.1 general substrate transporter [Talaromyces proteolyticus]
MGFFKNYRVYVLTTVAYSGSLLFGYDTGVMGSVLALTSFKKDFGLPTDSSGFASSANAQVSSNVVSLLTAGCFFGSIFAAFLNDRIGRRYSLMLFCLVFMLGAAIQVGAHHEIGMIYGGRVVAGLGIGGMSAITPVFVSENCLPETRGRVAGLFQEFLVIGSTFAYWLDYGVSLRVAPSTQQWRIPVAIQLIPGGLMFTGLFFLKESPRWLMRKGRHEEAHSSLAYIRNEPEDSESVMKEIAEIRASLEEELAATEGVTWKEAISKGNRYRFFLAFCLMFWQQFSGTNSIGYYAPEIFQTVGVSKTNASLFATGVYGSVKVVMTLIFLLVGIDFIGRKRALMGGAVWMAAMMFIIGAVLATHPPDVKSDTVSPASMAMVVMIYLYVIGYSASWGPTPWVYVSEIFPTRLRAYGVGLAAATQWLFNFVITEITPQAVNHIGWRTFLMFGIFCLAMGIFVTFFVKETKGRSLEDMDVLFGTVDAEQRAADVEQVMSKNRIEHEENVDESRAANTTTTEIGKA